MTISTQLYYIPFFTHEELASKDTNEIKLAPGFGDKLVELRTLFNKSMPITSACRSLIHNKKVGGSPTSFHVYDKPAYPTGGCCAVDVGIIEGKLRGDLIALAWSLGWSIGINKAFIHLDRRIDYTELKQTIFLY